MDETFRDGDIIVTPVAEHFAIGRITAAGKHEYVASENHRDAASARACRLAGQGRVFFNRLTPPRGFTIVDCEEIRP
jgi:hypothetical protein